MHIPNNHIHTHRRVVITIDIEDSGNNNVQQYIDQALKVWMIRGGGLNNNLTETRRDYGEEIRIHLHASHLWLAPVEMAEGDTHGH